MNSLYHPEVIVVLGREGKGRGKGEGGEGGEEGEGGEGGEGRGKEGEGARLEHVGVSFVKA